jgi:hypothetical protein
MAIFHLKSQIIKRSDGRSAVASAAYRSGDKLYDERLGRNQKSGRRDRVASSEIIAPDYAQPWAKNRFYLWNSLEAVEKRKDAQLAKDIEVALPNELSLRQQKELLAAWINEHFTQKGFVVDVNIHCSPIGKTDNDHAHVMSPLRAIDPDTGEWRKTKDRQESKGGFKDTQSADIEILRASWAKHVNAALQKAGYEDRQVDHRSNRARGIETEPTIHEGYASQAIEARGGHSWRAEFNRQIRKTNQQILAEIKAKATQAANAVKRAATANFRELAQRLARSPAETAPKPAPKAVPKPVLQPQRMRPDKLAEGPVDTTPKPAPKPVLQPPPMRPDKLAESPEPTAAPKKQEPAPAPIVAKPQPAKLPEMPPPAIIDAEAEKRKKAAQRAAYLQHGGGGIGS